MEDAPGMPAVPSTQTPAPAPPSPDPSDLCCICLERPPDTFVLPCQHQVVCRACSEALKATPNAFVCVICRQAITEVLMDEKR